MLTGFCRCVCVSKIAIKVGSWCAVWHRSHRTQWCNLLHLLRFWCWDSLCFVFVCLSSQLHQNTQASQSPHTLAFHTWKCSEKVSLFEPGLTFDLNHRFVEASSLPASSTVEFGTSGYPGRCRVRRLNILMYPVITQEMLSYSNRYHWADCSWFGLWSLSAQMLYASKVQG